jgi:hypothetical protein
MALPPFLLEEDVQTHIDLDISTINNRYLERINTFLESPTISEAPNASVSENDGDIFISETLANLFKSENVSATVLNFFVRLLDCDCIAYPSLASSANIAAGKSDKKLKSVLGLLC